MTTALVPLKRRSSGPARNADRSSRAIKPAATTSTTNAASPALSATTPSAKATGISSEPIQTRIDGLGVILDKHLETLYPGIDYKHGIVYLTVPALQEVTKTKDGHDYRAAQLIPTTVTSDRERFAFTEQELYRRGFTYPNSFVMDEESRWDPADVAAFLAGRETPARPLDLYFDIRNVFEQYVEYDHDRHYDLATLFVMFTYVFRVFRVTGYVHFNGTFQTGKSQNLSILRAFCLNAVWSSSMTPAALFRQVAGNPGTLCIDEAESFDNEKGSELRTILLGGYKAGNQAVRAERAPGGAFVNKRYETFGPKALGSINPLDPTLGSRTVVISMKPATRRIATFPYDSPTWSDMRNKLYLWAMLHTQHLSQKLNEWEMTLRHTRAPELYNRQWEVASQFIVIADYIGGPGLADPIIEWFDAYYRKQAEDNEVLDRARFILKVLPRVLALGKPTNNDFYSLASITDTVQSYAEEDQQDWIKPREVRKQLDVLGFTTKKAAAGGMVIQIREDDLRTTITRRKLAPFDEDAAWFEGQEHRQSRSLFADDGPALIWDQH